jgi:hypothetical protein
LVLEPSGLGLLARWLALLGPSFGGYLASALEVGFMRRRRSQSNRQLVESRW